MPSGPPRPPGPPRDCPGSSVPARGAPAGGRFCSLEDASSGFGSTLLPVGIAVRTKTLFSQMTGVAVPTPGILTFHLTFLVSFHSVGGSAWGATPFWRGPRHCGQFCSAEAEAPWATLNKRANPSTATKSADAGRSRPPHRAHLETVTGAPASRLRGGPERRFGVAAVGTALLHEPESKTPGRRLALWHSISLLVAVSSNSSTFRAWKGRMTLVSFSRPCAPPKRGAGFIPQEREHRGDGPAKSQSLFRVPTPLRTEVRAPGGVSFGRCAHSSNPGGQAGFALSFANAGLFWAEFAYRTWN